MPTLLFWLATLAPAAPAPSSPSRCLILTESAWYRGPAGEERSLVGRLVEQTGDQPPVSSSKSPLHPPPSGSSASNRDRAHLLRPFVGSRVRLGLKTVQVPIPVEGKPREQHLVGWIELLAPGAGPRAILARSSWQPPARPGQRIQVLVIRSGASAASLLDIRGPGADEAASRTLARHLGIASIDWERHMVLTVTAGLGVAQQLTILGATVRDGQLLVRYRLEPGPPGIGPVGQTVLLARHDGLVQILREEETPRPK